MNDEAELLALELKRIRINLEEDGGNINENLDDISAATSEIVGHLKAIKEELHDITRALCDISANQ